MPVDLLGLVCLILCAATPAVSALSIKKIHKFQDNFAIVLATLSNEGEYRNFCSGTITNIGIVTAGHCCAVGFANSWALFYSVDGAEYLPISKLEFDSQGFDMCVATPAFPIMSPISLADAPYENETAGTLKRDYWNISKISVIYNMTKLEAVEVQNVFLVSLDYTDASKWLFSGFGMPGMSGSGVLDMNGRLVGVLTEGRFRDHPRARADIDSWIPNIFAVDLVNWTQWGGECRFCD